jgi:hypothetical protein
MTIKFKVGDKVKIKKNDCILEQNSNEIYTISGVPNMKSYDSMNFISSSEGVTIKNKNNQYWKYAKNLILIKKK